MKVVIASNFEYDHVFAEICYQDACWARVFYSLQERRYILHIFPELIANGQGDVELDLEEVQEALEQAKVMLKEYGQVPE